MNETTKTSPPRRTAAAGDSNNDRKVDEAKSPLPPAASSSCISALSTPQGGKKNDGNDTNTERSDEEVNFADDNEADEEERSVESQEAPKEELITIGCRHGVCMVDHNYTDYSVVDEATLKEIDDEAKALVDQGKLYDVAKRVAAEEKIRALSGYSGIRRKNGCGGPKLLGEEEDKNHIENICKLQKMVRELAPWQLKSNVGGVVQPFPEKLMDVLDRGDMDEILHWMPHGRSFIVKNRRVFTAEVLPCFFKQTKIVSFQRQLNLWGFKRITQGPDCGAYYHELFLRGRPYLCTRIRRQRIKGTGIRLMSNPDAEPNFYKMSWMRTLHPTVKTKAKPLPPAGGLARCVLGSMKELKTDMGIKVAKNVIADVAALLSPSAVGGSSNEASSSSAANCAPSAIAAVLTCSNKDKEKVQQPSPLPLAQPPKLEHYIHGPLSPTRIANGAAKPPGKEEDGKGGLDDINSQKCTPFEGSMPKCLGVSLQTRKEVAASLVDIGASSTKADVPETGSCCSLSVMACDPIKTSDGDVNANTNVPASPLASGGGGIQGKTGTGGGTRGSAGEANDNAVEFSLAEASSSLGPSDGGCIIPANSSIPKLLLQKLLEGQTNITNQLAISSLLRHHESPKELLYQQLLEQQKKDQLAISALMRQREEELHLQLVLQKMMQDQLVFSNLLHKAITAAKLAKAPQQALRDLLLRQVVEQQMKRQMAISAFICQKLANAGLAQQSNINEGLVVAGAAMTGAALLKQQHQASLATVAAIKACGFADPAPDGIASAHGREAGSASSVSGGNADSFGCTSETTGTRNDVDGSGSSPDHAPTTQPATSSSSVVGKEGPTPILDVAMKHSKRNSIDKNGSVDFDEGIVAPDECVSSNSSITLRVHCLRSECYPEMQLQHGKSAPLPRSHSPSSSGAKSWDKGRNSSSEESSWGNKGEASFALQGHRDKASLYAVLPGDWRQFWEGDDAEGRYYVVANNEMGKVGDDDDEELVDQDEIDGFDSMEE